jgi:hypothetical protein
VRQSSRRARYEGIEPEYNLLTREICEADLESGCSDQGLGVLGVFTHSSLASGFLVWEVLQANADALALRAPDVTKRMNDRCFAIVDEVD